jgi:hypothetical protein
MKKVKTVTQCKDFGRFWDEETTLPFWTNKEPSA